MAVMKGNYGTASTFGIVTKIKNMPANGKLKHIGVADKQDEIWSEFTIWLVNFWGGG